MDKLPSIFNELWEFMLIPLLELLILVSLAYFVSDKTSLKAWRQLIFTNIPAKYRLLKIKYLSPLGITAVASLSGIVVIITLIVALNRINHIIGNLIPGNATISIEAALVNYGNQETLAKIWQTQPNIQNVSDLNQYIENRIEKESSAYPQMAGMLKYAQEQQNSIGQWRSFEKVLILYIIFIIPFTLNLLHINTKRIIIKSLLTLCFTLFMLTVNFYHTYKAIKLQYNEMVLVAGVVLAPEIDRNRNDQLREFEKKVQDYQKDVRNDWIVRPTFDLPTDF